LKRLEPVSDAPIAIRAAVDLGWRAYQRNAWPLSGFALLAGGLNLLAQLGFRRASIAPLTAAGDPLPALQLAAAASLLAWAMSGLWLLVGLMRGSEVALEGERVAWGVMLRPDWPGMLRSGGTLLLIAFVLIAVRALADASTDLLILAMPLLAGVVDQRQGADAIVWGVLVYLAADQVLCLPITVFGGASPLAAVQSGRRAIDPHWLQALGLLLVVGLLLLAGVLLLLAGLVVTLPLALCTLSAAYRQLFGRPGNRLAR
jgi:hypothetical protein